MYIFTIGRNCLFIKHQQIKLVTNVHNARIFAFLVYFFEILRPKGIFGLDIVYERGKKAFFLTVRKEVNSMEQPSFDKATVEHQYDTLMKKVLAGEAKNLRAKLSKRRATEVNFSDLGDNLIEKLGTYDEHLCEYSSFEVNGFDIIIRNELLAEAVTNLSERKRKIILMSFFLDLSDNEIAELLNLVRSTVTYHRENALERLKRFMEENDR